MNRTITIRNVPDEAYATLAERAADKGISLQELLLREITEIANRPDISSLLRHIRAAARQDGIAIDHTELLAILDEERSNSGSSSNDPVP
jgi:plasmid stability protein